MNFSKQIKEVRKIKNMSIAEVCKEAKVSAPTLKKIEDGGPDALRASVNTLQRVCNALGAKIIFEVELINETA